MQDIIIHLPFPPTVNTYYTKRKALSARGRKYKQAVSLSVHEQGMALLLEERLNLAIIMYMPDKRVRDLSNYLKALEDSLTDAGVWLDDEQIDQSTQYRGCVISKGKVVIRISEAAPVLPIDFDISNI